MLYEADEERDFVTGYLRPTLDREGLGDTKVFCWDHNKERVVDRAIETFGTKSGKAAFDGIAYHWYSGDHFEALDAVHQLFPEMVQISTENSGGAIDAIPWYVGERCAHEIIGDFKNYCSAFVDWNMILDETGHPYHWDAEREAAHKKGNNAFVNQEAKKRRRASTPIMWWEGKVRYELSYYYLGQFSKYVLPGARRIGSSSYTQDLEQIAFQNPDGTRVLVVMNKSDYNAGNKDQILKILSKYTASKSYEIFEMDRSECPVLYAAKDNPASFFKTLKIIEEGVFDE